MMRFTPMALVTAGLITLSSGTVSAAVNINLINIDAPGEGFNDPTPRAPVLNNPGTTLGQQRLNAFEAALMFWEEKLDSDIDIDVQAEFSPQFCSPNSATLGSAGPRALHFGAPEFPRANTVFYGALANSLTDVDLSPGNPEIGTTFNSDLDAGTGCLGNAGWDYRINPPNPTSLTIASTVLHELAHGLGFLTIVNTATGERPTVTQTGQELDDQFSVFLRDLTQNQTWPEMTNAQRQASALNNGGLVWDGDRAVNQSGFLTNGRNAGQPRMFAPTALIGGSSVSHWDTALQPNELMEPSSVVPQENWLTLKAMFDMGWSGNPCITSDLPNDQWVMLSLECEPPADENTVEDILADDIDGVYTESWIVYEFNPESSPTGGYVELALTDEMELGKGYWLGQVENMATVLDVPDESSRTPSPEICAVDSSRTCFEIPLRTTAGDIGFTFLGNPFRRDIPLDDMRIVTDSGTCSTGCTFAEADANGVIFPRLFSFDGVTETYSPLVSGDILPARMGAWSATVAGSDGLNPRLQMPR